MTPTTKACWYCGHTTLREFRSFNQKQCDACGHWMPWTLAPDQQPLVGSSRDRAYTKGENDG